jgi:Tfp pilus assembly protein PilF
LTAWLKNYERGAEFSRRLHAVAVKIHGEKSPQTAMEANNLGVMLYQLGHYAQAEGFLRSAYGHYSKQAGSNRNPELIKSIVTLLRSIQNERGTSGTR